MFGNEEGKVRGKPIKGRRYLVFTALMIVMLSIYIIMSSPSGEELIKDVEAENTKLDPITDSSTTGDNTGATATK